MLHAEQFHSCKENLLDMKSRPQVDGVGVTVGAEHPPIHPRLGMDVLGELYPLIRAPTSEPPSRALTVLDNRDVDRRAASHRLMRFLRSHCVELTELSPQLPGVGT